MAAALAPAITPAQDPPGPSRSQRAAATAVAADAATLRALSSLSSDAATADQAPTSSGSSLPLTTPSDAAGPSKRSTPAWFADTSAGASDAPAGASLAASPDQPDPIAMAAPHPSAPHAAAETRPAQPATPQPAHSPAAQLAPALVSLARGADGAQHLTLRLQPAELGQVEVRIERLGDAPVRVDITVQRPETLTLLLRDQPELQRTLDQAGLPNDGRSLTFHVAAPVPTGTVQPTPTAQNAGDPASGGADSGGTGQPSHQPRWDPPPDGDLRDTAEPAARGWFRAGLDITA